MLTGWSLREQKVSDVKLPRTVSEETLFGRSLSFGACALPSSRLHARTHTEVSAWKPPFKGGFKTLVVIVSIDCFGKRLWWQKD